MEHIKTTTQHYTDKRLDYVTVKRKGITYRLLFVNQQPAKGEKLERKATSVALAKWRQVKGPKEAWDFAKKQLSFS
ncbi:hypothetical protein F7U66_01760 [Vibrio parahaemolyticus]|nr:hypothetical protein [Vibrio parahaemolyticus]